MNNQNHGDQAVESIKQKFYGMITQLQDAITDRMMQLDPKLKLTEDLWERKDHLGAPGGGGRTRAFQGEIFENAGVNISKIYGAIDPQFAQALLKESGKTDGGNAVIFATGISLIIHPRNPRVPTVHANFRLLEVGGKFWFGGGADLTPFYPHPEDFEQFHQVWRKACAPYGVYEKFRATCDAYFVNKHRGNEMRGVGGIFFDHLNSGDSEQDHKMVSELAGNFMDSYFPLVEKRCQEKWDAEDEEFQLHRRGRYVEFNLLHDRGTLFGLKTNGRTDSILISLPARCKFSYAYAPKVGGVHEQMMKYYFA